MNNKLNRLLLTIAAMILISAATVFAGEAPELSGTVDINGYHGTVTVSDSNGDGTYDYVTIDIKNPAGVHIIVQVPISSQKAGQIMPVLSNLPENSIVDFGADDFEFSYDSVSNSCRFYAPVKDTLNNVEIGNLTFNSIIPNYALFTETVPQFSQKMITNNQNPLDLQVEILNSQITYTFTKTTEQPVTASIYDVRGRLIDSFVAAGAKGSEFSKVVNNLPVGCYVIVIPDNGRSVIKKFIIE